MSRTHGMLHVHGVCWLQLHGHKQTDAVYVGKWCSSSTPICVATNRFLLYNAFLLGCALEYRQPLPVERCLP